MHVYYGTYNRLGGRGIYHCAFDPDTCKQEILSVTEALNPTYLARSADGKRLYSVGELSEFEGEPGGMLAAYEVLPDGSLRFMNAQRTGGGAPCHLSLSPNERWLFAANYSGGNAVVFSINEDGSVGERQSLLIHTGSSIDKRRQTKPYCHFAYLTPDAAALCVADLGTDAVVCYPFDLARGVVSEDAARWRVTPGAGPRHLVFSPDGKYAYVVCEMGNLVEVFEYTGNGQARHAQTVSTLPEGFAGVSACAAIRMSVDGKTLYASNRGHDSVAAFSIGEDGLLTRIGITQTGGKNPRDIRFTPDGKHLLCGNQDGGGVTVLRVEPDGALSETGIAFPQIPSPVSILFI